MAILGIIVIGVSLIIKIALSVDVFRQTSPNYRRRVDYRGRHLAKPRKSHAAYVRDYRRTRRELRRAHYLAQSVFYHTRRQAEAIAASDDDEWSELMTGNYRDTLSS